MKIKIVQYCKNCILSHFNLNHIFEVKDYELNNSKFKNDEKFDRTTRVRKFIQTIRKAYDIGYDIYMKGEDCILDVQQVDNSFYFVTSKGYTLKDGDGFVGIKELDEDSLFAKLLSVDADTIFTITGLYNKDFQPVNPDNDESRKIIFECFRSYHLKKYNGIQISHYEDCHYNRKRYCIIQFFKKK